MTNFELHDMTSVGLVHIDLVLRADLLRGVPLPFHRGLARCDNLSAAIPWLIEQEAVIFSSVCNHREYESDAGAPRLDAGSAVENK